MYIIKNKLPFANRRLFILLLILLNNFSWAQQKDEIKSISSAAHKAYHVNDFESALNYYLMLDSLEPNNAETNAHIGICYINLKSKYKSLPYLEKAISLGYHKGDYLYFMGRAYHYNHRFDEAISFYEKYKAKTNNKTNIEEANHLIQNCNNGKELIKNPIDVKIENLGPNINSEYDDYAPVISADESVLILTSKRPNRHKKDNNGKYLEDIYISEKIDGKWSQAKNMGSPVNSDLNDASIGISMDGQQLFVYKDDSTYKDIEGGDIYVCNKINGKWSSSHKLDKNINTEAWEPSANISANEELLFFSSDQEGGFGGTDIYVSRRLPNNKGWGPAKNLGPIINTPFDEDAPFLHADGKTLYFISTGHNSIGGFDIFTSNFSSENYMVSKPENIGYPINTADDELFFTWSADGKRGYFSSERDETFGGEDIYLIRRSDSKKDLILLDGNIHSQGNPLAANISIIDNQANKVVDFYDSSKFDGKYSIVLQPGKNYAVFYESKNFLSHSENINVPPTGFYKFQKDIEMVPVDKGSLMVLENVFFESGKSELKEESYGELDRYYEIINKDKELLVEIAGHATEYKDRKSNQLLSQKRAEAIVDYLVKKGIDIGKLKAVGYGDKFKIIVNEKDDTLRLNTRTELVIVDRIKDGMPVASSQGFYFDKQKEKGDYISMRRENALRLITEEEKDRLEYGSMTGEAPDNKSKYLAKKEVDLFIPLDSSLVNEEDQERSEIKKMVKAGGLKPVKIEGYISQENKQYLSNALVRLVNDNGVVVEQQKTKTDGSYSFNSYTNTEKKYSLWAEKKGFFTQHIDVDVPANDSTKIIKITKNLALTKLEIGAKVVLRNIYFDFNKATLKRESYRELAKIIKVMKTHPKMTIEIAGHTDNLGPDYYNLLLSQKRAEAIVHYLTSHGISKGRLIAKGYGEEKPIASNDDETEGRELNRRIEFVVIEEINLSASNSK